MVSSFDSTQTLIRLTQNGDRDAYRELLAHYRERLRLAARYMLLTAPVLKSDLDSEDLADTVLARAIRVEGKSEYRGETGFWHLLLTRLRHAMYDKIANVNAQKRPHPHRRESLSKYENVLPARPSQGAAPPDAAIRKEDLECLEAALRRLPEDQRRAVVYCYLTGMQYPEVAKLLDRSPDAVRMLVTRGLNNLTRILVEQKTGSE